jgi:hypothetical protein
VKVSGEDKTYSVFNLVALIVGHENWDEQPVEDDLDVQHHFPEDVHRNSVVLLVVDDIESEHTEGELTYSKPKDLKA